MNLYGRTGYVQPRVPLPAIQFLSPSPGYLDQQRLSQRAVLCSKPAPLTGLLT